MQAKFVNRKYDCATIQKASIKGSEGFKTQKVIGVWADFGCKEELKAWAQERHGGWHPVEKFWWVPATVENLKTLKDLSFFKGEFYAPHPNLQEFISNNFDEEAHQIQPDTIVDEFSVFPEQETDYMSGYTAVRGEEMPQMQGWVEVKGSMVRVLCLKANPGGTPDWMQCEPRQYASALNGEVWWCIPWEDPTDRHAMPCWPDADIEGEAPEMPKTQDLIILEVKAIVKNREVVGARGYCQKGLSDYHWDRALSWCKSQPGRKWNADVKAWDIPLSAEFFQSIKIAKELDFQGGKIKFSEKLLATAE